MEISNLEKRTSENEEQSFYEIIKDMIKGLTPIYGDMFLFEKIQAESNSKIDARLAFGGWLITKYGILGPALLYSLL